MQPTELEILKVAAAIGTVIHLRGGANDAEIARLESWGYLRLVSKESSEAARRLTITRQGRAYLTGVAGRGR